MKNPVHVLHLDFLKLIIRDVGDTEIGLVLTSGNLVYITCFHLF